MTRTAARELLAIMSTISEAGQAPGGRLVQSWERFFTQASPMGGEAKPWLFASVT